MEKKFTCARTGRDIAIFTSIILIGAALAFIPSQKEANLGGYTLIALGILLAFLLKSKYKDAETHENYVKKEFSFPREMKPIILTALLTSPDSINLSEEGKGHVLMLRMYYGQHSGKAYLQLFEYVPHQFEPCSEMFEYEACKVTELLR